MKTTNKAVSSVKAKGVYLFLGIGGLVLYFSLHCLAAGSSVGFNTIFRKTADTSSATAIQTRLSSVKNSLYYPLSTERFYKKSGYKLLWIAPDTIKSHAADAMLMLDCVLQFGLNYADYHPHELIYTKLALLTKQFSKQSNDDKAAFDVMLTDALITYINHLHYGKLNPDYAADKIDQGNIAGFSAEVVLDNALKQKSFDFMKIILSVQPQSIAYKNLQYHMRLLGGLYTGDCYDTPDSVIRKMAINMERLRWVNTEEQTYIAINIPSYSLQFHQPDTTYQFKVIVGKPEAPTPTLQSAIGYFTTAPEWKVPGKIFVRETLPKALQDISYLENNHYAIYDEKGNYISVNKAKLSAIKRHPQGYYARQSSGCDNSLGLVVFRFPNVYDIYLHDTPEQKLFKKDDRAFSHGCIRVEQAEKLAGLLLKNDGAANQIAAVHEAMAAYKTRTFTLKNPVSIKVTYLTCDVKKGELVMYKDIYNLDKSLEMALYNMASALAMK